MYIALTEEYGVLIRKTGLSVIQFKYCMRKCMSTFTYLFEKAVKILLKQFVDWQNHFLRLAMR